MKAGKLIYSDKNSLAYEKNGVRYSVMHGNGKVLVSEMKGGELAEYFLEVDDAIACLRSSPEADYATEFLRKLKRKRGAAMIFQSLRILVKLTAHILLSLAAGVVIGYFLNLWAGG